MIVNSHKRNSHKRGSFAEAVQFSARVHESVQRLDFTFAHLAYIKAAGNRGSLHGAELPLQLLQIMNPSWRLNDTEAELRRGRYKDVVKTLGYRCPAFKFLIALIEDCIFGIQRLDSLHSPVAISLIENIIKVPGQKQAIRSV